nr:SS18-like protein 2 [Pelodiscus sinensis]|eukprot:XP_006130622.1 SS18-like protein 2 [Pelodiscus sinensis]
MTQKTRQSLLDENDQLIRCIVEYQNKGRATECVQYQHILHRNIIYLATIADAAPPTVQKTD